VAAIAVTDLYGMHSALIPYYVRVGKGSWDLSRLLINQPTLLGHRGLFVLWGCYIVSTVALVVMGMFLAFKRRENSIEIVHRTGFRSGDQ
jgi:hypothetical protein